MNRTDARLDLRIQEELCWGCQACEVACKMENEAPAGLKRIWVDPDGPRLTEAGLFFQFRVHRCRHCDDAPCAEVCPDEAIEVRGDGIVVLHEDACTGCESCLAACPYDAIEFDAAGEHALKCNLCHHRIDQGLLPACADNVCLAHCIHLEHGSE